MRRFGLCAAMFLLTAATTARADTWAPSEAKTLYNEGRFLDAARAFEAAYRESGRTGILYNAGLAREAAGPGNDALALLNWRRFLADADDITEAERDDLGRRITTAEARTAIVEFLYDSSPNGHPQGITLRLEGADEADRLEVDWPQDQAKLRLHIDLGKWTVQIRGPQSIAQELSFHANRASSEALMLAIVGTHQPPLEPMPVRISLGPKRALRHGINLSWTGPTPAERPKTRKAHATGQKWSLPPGAWTLHANANGYAPVESLVTISDTPVRLTIELESKVDWARVGLGAGLGTASAGFLIGGGLLLPGGLTDDLENYKETPSAKLGESAGKQFAPLQTSLALFGSGVGLAIPAVTHATTTKRRVFLIEAALGGAFAITGTGLLISSATSRDDLSQATTKQDFNKQLSKVTTHGASGGATLGLGAGLLGGASLSLLTRAILDKRSAPRANSTQLGINSNQHGATLSLAGRF